MVVITINDIISFILIGLLILGFITYIGYGFIRERFDRKFRKNCYKCKHWKLNNVAGSGGIAWYKCEKNCLEDEIRQDFNDTEYYVKCEKFEED